MKKFMRIALVFALAGAALVGCTKDYSGDISDLNKEVSAIQSTLTSLQTSIQGAQSAADAAAATANTALSAAKAAATADDLKAVQTALAAAATSADLTAVDAKYAAYIPAIKAAATASDLEALETAIKAAIAATDVKVADLEKALEAYAKKADLDEAVTRIATLETNYIALEARVAKLEAAKEDIQKLIDANAKGIETNAKAIEDLQKLVEELTAQVEGAFSIKGVSQVNQVNYYYANWKPGNTKTEKEYFAKLAEEFPELKEIEKGDVVASCTNVPFIVTPSTVAFDETDSFSLVDINGEDFGWELGEPFASPANVKAGTAGVWFAKVLAPAYTITGAIKESENDELALFIERADGSVAQTSFDYSVKAEKRTSAVEIKYQITDVDCDAEDFEENAYELNDLIEHFTSPINDDDKTTIYDKYFVIEPTSEVEVEKYGVSVDGETLTVEKLPKAGESIKLHFEKTAIMLDGRTAKSNKFEVNITGGAVAANAELADQTVTLGYNAKAAGHEYEVAVDYAVKDFGFTALEWDTVFTALKTKTEKLFAERDDETFSDYHETDELGTDGHIEFLDKDKKVKASTRPVYNMAAVSSEDVAYIRFVINSQNAIPGEYSVKITDRKVFCAVGNVTVKNPAAKPVKIAEKLCENGVLLVVGDTPASGFITYDLTNALVTTDHFGGKVSTTTPTTFTGYKFEDVAFEAATEETSDQKVEENWIASDKKTFTIPTWNGKWGAGYEHNNKNEQKLLNTVREFAVYFNWFKDGEQNIDSLHFKAQAVSPIWTKDGANITVKTTDADGNVLVNTTIYYAENATAKEYKSTDLTKAQFSGKYVAGNNSGNAFDVTNSGVTQVDFEWKQVEKETDAFPAYGQPNYITVSKTINNSNVKIDETTTSVDLVVDGNNRPIVIPLETVLDGGWGIDYATYANWKEIGFTVYLTKENWIDMYNNVWQKYWCPTYKYDGKYIPWNGTGYILGGYDATDETAVKKAIGDVEKMINDLAKSSVAADRQEYTKYKYFVEQLGVIKFSTKLNKENCWTANAFVEGKPVTLKPDELERLPYFTCKNAENYTRYVTFNDLDEGEAPEATDHITTISTYGNDAGKSTVEIPLTLNVVDKWGMTTEKEFTITVKVK